MASDAQWASLSWPGGRGGLVFRHRAERTPPMAVGHRHAEWELNLVRRGRAVYAVSGRRVELTRDSLLWLLPTQGHVLMERSAGFEMYVVVIRPSLLGGLASGPGFGPWAGWLSGDDKPTGPLHRVLAEAAAEGLAAQCAALASARWAEEPADGRGPAHYDAGLVWLAAEAWRAYAAAADRPEGSHLHPAVQRALEELDQRELGDPPEPSPLDLDAIARRCHVSRPHLSRLFHRETGMTLTEFRNRRRVERFLATLGRGRSVTLTQAAYAAGFGSYTQAFRSVKAVTGLGPREHLRRLRAG